MTKMLKAEHQKNKQEDRTKRPTPKYDKVCKAIKKIASATAQTYIPKACDALRADWYWDVSDKMFKENTLWQHAIRDRVYDDWDRDRNSEGLWKETYIRQWFPEWLRRDASEIQQDKLRQARNKYQSLIGDKKKQEILRLADSLRESVIPPQEEPTINTEGHIVERSPLLRGLGEKPQKSIMTLYGEINTAVRDAYLAIIQEEWTPKATDDLLVDHIKPAREKLKSFALEIKNADPGGMFNGLLANLRYANTAINEMISIMSEVGSSD